MIRHHRLARDPAAGTATPATVSVIIPTFNGAQYIAETMASVLDQTRDDLELIVVDDGSTDRTREIVAGYGPPVRLVTQPNAGVSTARNRGIREARGAFICLLDQDDYWFPDKLERQLQAMAAHPQCGVVYSSFFPWQPDAAGIFPTPGSYDPSRYPDDIDPEYSGWIYHQLLIDCWMLTSTAMFRQDVFERCGSFDETLPYSEDWALWLVMSRTYPFVKLNRPSTLYRQHPRQGNRTLRRIDYRTRLLAAAVRQWGLCSRDGRCLDARTFARQLAAYHAEFAFHHLRAGNRATAARSLVRAWVCHPSKMKYLAQCAAGLLGWRPNW